MNNRGKTQKPIDIKLVSIGLYKSIPIDISTDINIKKYDCDYLYEDLTDLVGAVPKLRPWFIKRFYTLGKEKTLKLASVARADGKNPQKLFTYLLNKEYDLKTKNHPN